MASWVVPILENVEGDGFPECEWDFAAWEGALKITANCPGACLTLRGDQLTALENLLVKAREAAA